MWRVDCLLCSVGRRMWEHFHMYMYAYISLYPGGIVFFVYWLGFKLWCRSSCCRCDNSFFCSPCWCVGVRVPRPRLSNMPRLSIAGLCYWLQHVVASMWTVESGRARTCGRDCVRKGCDLVYSLISCCACILSSGSYIIMSRPEDTIALVALWYEENMRKPVETKGRHPAEKRLAQKWHALLKH